MRRTVLRAILAMLSFAACGTESREVSRPAMHPVMRMAALEFAFLGHDLGDIVIEVEASGRELMAKLEAELSARGLPGRPLHVEALVFQSWDVAASTQFMFHDRLVTTFAIDEPGPQDADGAARASAALARRGLRLSPNHPPNFRIRTLASDEPWTPRSFTHALDTLLRDGVEVHPDYGVRISISTFADDEQECFDSEVWKSCSTGADGLRTRTRMVGDLLQVLYPGMSAKAVRSLLGPPPYSLSNGAMYMEYGNGLLAGISFDWYPR